MKKLLLQVIAACSLLLTVSQVEAKTFGGFKKNDKFSLKLDYFTSLKEVGTVFTDKQPIPAGVPKFKPGSKVEFTIGKKGQLTAKGMSIPFKGVDTLVRIGDVLYESPEDMARIGKSAKGKPVMLGIDFKRTEVKAGVTTTYRVYYSFVK